MKPLYKIGDKVKSKSCYDPGCCDLSYPDLFTKTMLMDFGGQVVTITTVNKSFLFRNFAMLGDSYVYGIKEDRVRFSWASMFEDKTELPPILTNIPTIF